MINQIMYEIKLNIKKVTFTALTLGVLVFASLLFYPSIADNMDLLNGFFENDFMKNTLIAFGMNINSFKSLLGFYAAYSSMFVVLVGSIFLGYFAADVISKEEKQGTIEYLLSRPTSRTKIFFSKFIAVTILTLIFTLVITLLGYSGLEFQKKNAHYSLQIANKTELIDQKILAKSSDISQWFTKSDDHFNSMLYSILLKEFNTNKNEIKEAGINEKDMEMLFSLLKQSPENLFIEVKKDPQRFKNMFSASNLTDEEFLAEVNKSEEEFRGIKQKYLNSEDIISDFYPHAQGYFLEQFVKLNKVNDLNEITNGIVLKSNLYQKYSLRRFLILSGYMAMVIYVLASLSFAFSAIMKPSFNSSQITMVAILVMYFLNTFGSISEKTKILTKITPFGYINTDVTLATYNFSISSTIFLSTIIFIGIISSYIVYRKKDFS